jgi:DNA-binding MarR family transcriptional regulator
MRLGLSGAVLAALSKDEMTVRQLADALGATSASVYITVQRHRLIGRVSRRKSQEFGRQFLYRITPSGKKKMEWLETHGIADGERTVGGLFEHMKRSASKYLESMEEVPMSNPVDLGDGPGVYFLYKNGKIAYIGKPEKALFDRILSQATSKRGSPYVVKHLPIDGDLDRVSVRKVEDWLILAFNPSENSRGGAK